MTPDTPRSRVDVAVELSRLVPYPYQDCEAILLHVEDDREAAYRILRTAMEQGFPNPLVYFAQQATRPQADG